MFSSILNLFLPRDGMSGACSGSIKSWLCIAVPQRSAHFPTFNHKFINLILLQNQSRYYTLILRLVMGLLWPAKKERIWASLRLVNKLGLTWLQTNTLGAVVLTPHESQGRSRAVLSEETKLSNVSRHNTTFREGWTGSNSQKNGANLCFLAG